MGKGDNKQRGGSEEKGAPLWIVSFSDMVTLLLAFFVLLQTFAQQRDPELFYAGQGSFRRAIAGLGIPDLLFGKQDRARFDYAKTRHPVEQDTEAPSRTRILNARDEEIRLRFKKIADELLHEAADSHTEVLSVEATPVRFAAGGATIEPAGADYLERFARHLRQNVRNKQIVIQVIGLARDVPAGRQRWVVSAERAAAAEAALRKALGPVLAAEDWRLISWGAADGAQWCRKYRLGTVSPETSIVLVVLRVGE